MLMLWWRCTPDAVVRSAEAEWPGRWTSNANVKYGGRGFKSRSAHWVVLFSVVPGFTHSLRSITSRCSEREPVAFPTVGLPIATLVNNHALICLLSVVYFAMLHVCSFNILHVSVPLYIHIGPAKLACERTCISGGDKRQPEIHQRAPVTNKTYSVGEWSIKLPDTGFKCI